MALFSLKTKKIVPETRHNKEDARLLSAGGQTSAEQEKCVEYEKALQMIRETLEAVMTGDMERRIINIDSYDDNVVRTFNALNAVLDITDAFIRESTAMLEHACDKKYYRRFVERGMMGSFLNGAKTLNKTRLRMQQMEQEAWQKTLDLSNNFENKISSVVLGLSSATQQLSDSAQEMKNLADENFTKSQEVSGAAEVATGNVNAVASAVEELSSSINEITNQVQASSAATKEAVSGSITAGEAVKGLENSANQIDRVVELIRTIAGQTNLLALNATIEAARAGEAGKGFAVVASEVKNLANETSNATDDIVAQVENIQKAIKHTVETIEDISAKINEVDNYSAAISATLTQQNAATMEISRNIQEAASGTTLTAEKITDISASSRSTSDMASEVSTAIENVSHQIVTMKQEVEDFLAFVRNKD
ncbi:methyl-accepting chemotaxis protein [Luteithermobacter gelatinilyticus]|uniref:methyl-accepting chemotaxis protein n=1 Tax=Luteithermobacter gelatinilyticus TaxID=2582913 RepID=UPI0011058B3B|nr:methyl-accepting chemotaxis protein [Luteithermobacter gelatinilyticus]